MSASNPFQDNITVSLEIAVQSCDDITDLEQQRKEIERLNALLIEAGKAGVDISYYLSCYMKWIAQTTIKPEYLYIAKIYIAHATELLQYVKDIEIKESHEDVFSTLSLQLDDKIKSNIKEWIKNALKAMKGEGFDADEDCSADEDFDIDKKFYTVEVLLKQVVDNLKFIHDSSEREINAAVLSHCYSILISHKIEKAEDFIANNNFGAAKKQREEARNFLKHVKDEEIRIFHEGRLRDPQQKIIESSPESSPLPEKRETSLSNLSFARLSQFFSDTFDLETEGTQGDTPSPRTR